MGKLTFADFRDGFGGRVCRAIGLDISGVSAWSEYTEMLVSTNNGSGGGLLDKMRSYDGVASSGERAVLHAAMAAGDFASQADELAGIGFWDRTDRLGTEVRVAIAAAVLRAD